MIQATYAGSTEHDNTKGLLFTLKFTGNYGVLGVGDLVNLAPYEQSANATGVLDPNVNYDLILVEPPKNVGVFNENIGGSYTNLAVNAAPTLQNLGVRVFEPGGNEKATGAAYTAVELAGSVTILVFVPLQ